MRGGIGLRNVALVASSHDPAGQTMVQLLREAHGFVPTEQRFDGVPIYAQGPLQLLIGNRDIVHLDNVDQHVQADVYIFLSRHRSESGIPALTAHFTGNFGAEARFGGRPGELAYADPPLLRAYLRALWAHRERLPNFEIVMEATHHGPTALSRPVLFIEIGSTEAQWTDPKVAGEVLDVLLRVLQSDTRVPKLTLGFGGPHYAHKFTRLLLDSDFAVGPVAAKYALPSITPAMLRQMLAKTPGSVHYAAVEWKGLGPEKERLLRLLEEAELQIHRL